jgi:hypothetical protein
MSIIDNVAERCGKVPDKYSDNAVPRTTGPKSGSGNGNGDRSVGKVLEGGGGGEEEGMEEGDDSVAEISQLPASEIGGEGQVDVGMEVGDQRVTREDSLTSLNSQGEKKQSEVGEDEDGAKMEESITVSQPPPGPMSLPGMTLLGEEADDNLDSELENPDLAMDTSAFSFSDLKRDETGEMNDNDNVIHHPLPALEPGDLDSEPEYVPAQSQRIIPVEVMVKAQSPPLSGKSDVVRTPSTTNTPNTSGTNSGYRMAPGLRLDQDVDYSNRAKREDVPDIRSPFENMGQYRPGASTSTSTVTVKQPQRTHAMFDPPRAESSPSSSSRPTARPTKIDSSPTPRYNTDKKVILGLELEQGSEEELQGAFKPPKQVTTYASTAGRKRSETSAMNGKGGEGGSAKKRQKTGMNGSRQDSMGKSATEGKSAESAIDIDSDSDEG